MDMHWADPNEPGEAVEVYWDDPVNHFEVLCHPEGKVEVFYRNRSTGTIWLRAFRLNPEFVGLDTFDPDSQ